MVSLPLFPPSCFHSLPSSVGISHGLVPHCQCSWETHLSLSAVSLLSSHFFTLRNLGATHTAVETVPFGQNQIQQYSLGSFWIFLWHLILLTILYLSCFPFHSWRATSSRKSGFIEVERLIFIVRKYRFKSWPELFSGYMLLGKLLSFPETKFPHV